MRGKVWSSEPSVICNGKHITEFLWQQRSDARTLRRNHASFGLAGSVGVSETVSASLTPGLSVLSLLVMLSFSCASARASNLAHSAEGEGAVAMGPCGDFQDDVSILEFAFAAPAAAGAAWHSLSHDDSITCITSSTFWQRCCHHC
jgi:hypothetical protein